MKLILPANLKWFKFRKYVKTKKAEVEISEKDEMMRAIINNNNKELNAVRRAFEALQQAA